MSRRLTSALAPAAPALAARARRPVVSGSSIALVILLRSSRGGRLVGPRSATSVAPAVLVVIGVVSWLVTRWRIEDGDLRIETGLIRRSSLRFPLSQMQAIDTVRPLLARLFGLAELRLRMGGSGGARPARLPPPPRGRAAARTAAGARPRAPREDTPAAARGGAARRCPSAALVASSLLSRLGRDRSSSWSTRGARLAASSAARLGAVARSLPILGLAGALWQRFNGEYKLDRRRGARRAPPALGPASRRPPRRSRAAGCRPCG